MKLIFLCFVVAFCNEKTYGEEFFLDESLEGSVMEYFSGDDGCHCELNECSCCKTLSLPVVQISKEVCIRLEFKNAENAFYVKFTLDGSEIFDRKVQGKNPRPLCVNIPLLKHLVNVCIELADIKMDTTGLQGCVNLVASAIVEKKFQIGCFKMPTAFLIDDDDVLVFERKIEIRN
ncbi:uncharacterized protein LOC133204860 [Saccostrea echinata]|uniref:uncharacterized protein LOC133204860 n=1 Tax=Saccostrea echinata TaxID=191078 RepID=UPI002A81C65D|nr:uncharacterized protein LOC133204860 [Saccostrea echinata]